MSSVSVHGHSCIRSSRVAAFPVCVKESQLASLDIRNVAKLMRTRIALAQLESTLVQSGEIQTPLRICGDIRTLSNCSNAHHTRSQDAPMINTLGP